MKILLFSTQWPEYMIELANGLSSHCQTILMLPTNHRFTPAHKKLISNKVKFEPYKVVFYKSFRENLRMLRQIVKVIWRHKPDILHIQANGHRLFYWIFFLKPFKTKIVNTIHDPVKHLGDGLSHALNDNWIKFWSKIFTHKFIVHGVFLKDQLSKFYKINKSRIVVIPHGHLEIFKEFQRYRSNEDSNTILFFGRIWKYKGLDIFIEAANKVVEEKPELKFIIAGKGEDITKYKQKVKFNTNIIFDNRRIPIEEVGLFFDTAAFVVLPYIEATQSGVIPLAYAYSKPVIATNVGSLSEVVKNNSTGLLIEPNSPESLISAIMNLVKNENKRKEMGHNAYKFAMRELSWDIIAFKTTEIYKTLI